MIHSQPKATRLVCATMCTIAILLTCAEVARAREVDVSALTKHPDLYIESTEIPSNALQRSNCEIAGKGATTSSPSDTPQIEIVLGSRDQLEAQYRSPRFLNFIPNARQTDEIQTRWTSEPSKVPSEPGTYEATIHPCATATEAQSAAAQELLEKSFDAAVRNGWFDKEKALADGYRIQHHGEHVHFVNSEYLTDGEVLSPDKPEFLVFFEENGVPELAGFMYVMEGVMDRGPQIGGPLTVWHYHVMHPMCMKDGLHAGMPDADGNCATGERTTRSPEMLHSWFWKRKDGPFSSDMSMPAK